MTGTIFDFFTKWGDYDFRRLHIQEADLVAFGLLSYATFENTDFYKQVKNENKFFEIKKFAQEGFEKLNKTNLIPNGYSKFLHRFFSIKRYKRIKIGYFDDEVNKDKKIQFFAFTISFSNFNIVCFRGTDTSIVGWEEDLNMAADEYVPSQIAALNYVNKILENDEKDLIILGHSKGGNLAYYSFFKTSEENKKRIKKVYNFDGPGFRNDTFDYQKYSKNLAPIYFPTLLIATSLPSENKAMPKTKAIKEIKNVKSVSSDKVPLGIKFEYCKEKIITTIIAIGNTLRKASNNFLDTSFAIPHYNKNPAEPQYFFKIYLSLHLFVLNFVSLIFQILLVFLFSIYTLFLWLDLLNLAHKHVSTIS